MTYRECLEYFAKIPDHISMDGLPDDTYLQFDLIGKESGHFYVHLSDGRLEVTEGEYKMRQVQFIAAVSGLEKILRGNMDPIYAYATGKLNIAGDVTLGRNFLSRVARKKGADN